MVLLEVAGIPPVVLAAVAVVEFQSFQWARMDHTVALQAVEEVTVAVVEVVVVLRKMRRDKH
jgi:hypothetical protein